ncbi:MAG: endonuclease domain-containing protein [Patescibacteria group bacterium]
MNEATKEKLCTKHKCEFTRFLRKNMTPEEKKIWNLLRDRKCHDIKFCRQVNIGPFIADFLCRRKKTIIEVDGGIHNTKERREYDIERDKYLRSKGYQTLRITNEEIHNSMPNVLSKIHNFVSNHK